MNFADHKKQNLALGFAVLVLLISLFGFLILVSASMGRLEFGHAHFASIVINQFIALLVSVIAMIVALNIDYKLWRKIALPFFIISIILTFTVFIPGLGISAGGASRWINIAGFSFQPAEILKLGVIIYFAGWLASVKDKASDFKFGLLPFAIIFSLSAFILALQPDTGTAVVIFSAMAGMIFVAGLKWRYVLLAGLIFLLVMSILIYQKDYIRDRLLTFLNYKENVQESSYQINQSFLTVGSGQLFGRGFGQSLQKFRFLPQPTADSIFAIAAEEFGFIGSNIIIIAFMVFTFMGFKIAARAPDNFGRLLTIGIVILIVSQSLINIGAILGIFPLTGLPLIFISQGGSALLIALFSCGIIINIARKQK